MASVCFYFEVHQPFRLRRYSVFDTDRHYFDDFKNGDILRKVAHKCYLPANRVMLETIRMHEGRFRIAYSITGTALEVAPVCDLPLLAKRRGAKLIVINQSETYLDPHADVLLRGDVAEVLPIIADCKLQIAN